MKAKGSQMERLIQAAGGAPADGSQVPSKYPTAGQMERLIEAVGEGSGSGSGYTVTEEQAVVIPEQTVTANMAAPYSLGYAAQLSGVSVTQVNGTLLATVDGVEYNLPPKVNGGMTYFGATVTIVGEETAIANWEECPFVIFIMGGESLFAVEAESTHILSAVDYVSDVNPSENFTKAVREVDEPFVVNVQDERMSYTVGEIYEAYRTGRRIQFNVDDNVVDVTHVDFRLGGNFPVFSGMFIGYSGIWERKIVSVTTPETLIADTTHCEVAIYNLTPAT